MAAHKHAAAVLAISDHLYRIAESDNESIQRAQSIPNLRSPQWQR